MSLRRVENDVLVGEAKFSEVILALLGNVTDVTLGDSTC